MYVSIAREQNEHMNICTFSYFIGRSRFHVFDEKPYFYYYFSVNHSNIGETSETINKSNETKEPTKKKHKMKHLSEEQRLLTDMPDERLQMYGLNPNRFKKFVRFNKDKLKK